MTSELAKQLKEAGFPQSGKGEVQFFIGDQRVRDEAGMHADSYYFPTLSELIAACGNLFDCLRLTGVDTWACGGYIEGEWDEDSIGKTPEEAVAKLWLSLNKKP